MWAAKVLRGDITGVTGKSPIPGRGQKLKGRSGSPRLSRAEKAYLLEAAKCTAAAKRAPSPPTQFRDAIIASGSLAAWISSSSARKAFYVSTLQFEKRAQLRSTQKRPDQTARNMTRNK